MDFAILPDHEVWLKESKKRDKLIYFAIALRKLWNMKATIILIVIGTFYTVPTRLVKQLEDLELREQVETILTKSLLRLARIRTIVQDTWIKLLSHKLQSEAFSWRWCETQSK